jgi:hypothetical protein
MANSLHRNSATQGLSVVIANPERPAALDRLDVLDKAPAAIFRSLIEVGRHRLGVRMARIHLLEHAL